MRTSFEEEVRVFLRHHVTNGTIMAFLLADLPWRFSLWVTYQGCVTVVISHLLSDEMRVPICAIFQSFIQKDLGLINRTPPESLVEVENGRRHVAIATLCGHVHTLPVLALLRQSREHGIRGDGVLIFELFCLSFLCSVSLGFVLLGQRGAHDAGERDYRGVIVLPPTFFLQGSSLVLGLGGIWALLHVGALNFLPTLLGTFLLLSFLGGTWALGGGDAIAMNLTLGIVGLVSLGVYAPLSIMVFSPVFLLEHICSTMRGGGREVVRWTADVLWVGWTASGFYIVSTLF